MSTVNRITNYLKAGFPGIAIETTEEARACADVIAAAKAAGKGVGTWSATSGLNLIMPDTKPVPDTRHLDGACEQAQEMDDIVWIFFDVQTWPVDRDPVMARRIRDLLAGSPESGCCVIFIGSQFKGHASFEKLVTVMEYELPSKADLRTIAGNILESSGRARDVSDEVVRALGGLSTSEAENALALSLVEAKHLDPAIIYREKIAAVKRTGLLEIVNPHPAGLDAIGGLQRLKEWILKRRRAYTPEAEKFGLPLPKGVLLVGVPGTGKSLSARAFGTALGVPTVKLDIGKLFGSLVGESEQKARDALALAEAMAPCVLWVDEIDKGLAGSGGGGSSDSGVTRRVFGTIITWMQERKRPVFLVATANQVEGLPPELLRKGRFDEVFAIDLPSASERAAILGIQLAFAGRTDTVNRPEQLGPIVEATDGFTGSEIESLVTEGLYAAFDRGADAQLEPADLLAAAKATVPLSTTAKEQIDGIRAWAKARARFASEPDAPVAHKPATPGKRRMTKE